MRVRGPVIWIKQQDTGKRRTVNRDKVISVDPEIAWEEVNTHPIRETAVNRNQHAEIGRMFERNIQQKHWTSRQEKQVPEQKHTTTLESDRQNNTVPEKISVSSQPHTTSDNDIVMHELNSDEMMDVDNNDDEQMETNQSEGESEFLINKKTSYNSTECEEKCENSCQEK